jgi:hypothetical protein
MRVRVGVPAHALGGSPSRGEQPRDLLQRLGDVPEEALEARAQVLSPGWPSGVVVKRSFAHPPWQANRASQSWQ